MIYMYIIVKPKGQKVLQFKNVKHKKTKIVRTGRGFANLRCRIWWKKILECKPFDKVLQICIDKMWPNISPMILNVLKLPK
jgi:hypothetical protein